MKKDKEVQKDKCGAAVATSDALFDDHPVRIPENSCLLGIQSLKLKAAVASSAVASKQRIKVQKRPQRDDSWSKQHDLLSSAGYNQVVCATPLLKLPKLQKLNFLQSVDELAHYSYKQEKTIEYRKPAINLRLSTPMDSGNATNGR